MHPPIISFAHRVVRGLVALLMLLLIPAKAAEVNGKTFDLVIIGATPGGIACAVRAAREGCTVLLVQHNRHIGGMLINEAVKAAWLDGFKQLQQGTLDAAKYVKDSELPYNEIAKKVVIEEGVTWNDLWSLVRPRQAGLQIPRNVHFQAKGSSVMAEQVAERIRAALPPAGN